MYIPEGSDSPISVKLFHSVHVAADSAILTVSTENCLV